MILNQPVQKLGFGLMRLPRKGKEYDLDQCREMVDRFLAAQQAYEELRARGPAASDCTGCGQCEQVCPQHLPVVSLLQDCARTFEGQL